VDGGTRFVLSPDVGMFSYPVPSPRLDLNPEETAHMVAYLQARFPNQSETSRYDLARMDRDGSNKFILFPPEGSEGLQPQKMVWSPDVFEANGNYAIGLIYQQNLWLVDSMTGEAWQITGDGLTSRIDWN
jgi:hypothetical protein